MPINSSHEFTGEEISLIEKTVVSTMQDGRRVDLYLTLGDVREALADFSVNKEGSAELELETAMTIAIDRLKGRKLVLESYLQNEVSEDVAREGQASEGSVSAEAEATDSDTVPQDPQVSVESKD